MGQSLEKFGGATIRDALNTEAWMTDGCANASEGILQIHEPQMRDILQRWKDDANNQPDLYLNEYSTLVYKIAEEMLGQCTQNEVEVFVHPGWCLGCTRHQPGFVSPLSLPMNTFIRSLTSASQS